jgi:hypothetical protein
MPPVPGLGRTCLRTRREMIDGWHGQAPAHRGAAMSSAGPGTSAGPGIRSGAFRVEDSHPHFIVEMRTAGPGAFWSRRTLNTQAASAAFPAAGGLIGRSFYGRSVTRRLSSPFVLSSSPFQRASLPKVPHPFALREGVGDRIEDGVSTITRRDHHPRAGLIAESWLLALQRKVGSRRLTDGLDNS